MTQFYFTRNDQSAIKANGLSRIAPHEFQVIKITQAYWGSSNTGAKFLSLNLVNASNETADDIKIYFENGSGDKLSGYNQINAILAFNNIAGLNQVQGNYRTYDFDAGGVTEKTGLIAPEIIGAYVGVVLSENYYVGQNGVKHNLNISSVFHHQTKKNAKQHLGNLPVPQGQIEQAISYAQKSSEDSKAKAEREAVGGQNYEPQSFTYQRLPASAVQKPVASPLNDDEVPF